MIVKILGEHGISLLVLDAVVIVLIVVIFLYGFVLTRIFSIKNNTIQQLSDEKSKIALYLKEIFGLKWSLIEISMEEDPSLKNLSDKELKTEFKRRTQDLRDVLPSPESSDDWEEEGWLVAELRGFRDFLARKLLLKTIEVDNSDVRNLAVARYESITGLPATVKNSNREV